MFLLVFSGNIIPFSVIASNNVSNGISYFSVFRYINGLFTESLNKINLTNTNIFNLYTPYEIINPKLSLSDTGSININLTEKIIIFYDYDQSLNLFISIFGSISLWFLQWHWIEIKMVSKMINNRTIIKIENLNKSYKNKKEINKIADNLNIEIKQKDKIGLLGKNGAGKTTILNMIIGKTKPDSGKITFNQEIISDQLKDISYLQQSFKFPNFFKVKDIKNLIVKDIRQKKIYDENLINKISNVLGIEFLINKKYQKLSGGEKQKINLFFSYCL